MKWVAVGIGGLLLAVGMWLSIRDYRQWKYLDMRYFGQGPAEQYTAAEALSERYDQQQVQFRLRYPAGWMFSKTERYVSIEAVAGRALRIMSWKELFGSGTTLVMTIRKNNVNDKTVPTVNIWLGTVSKATVDVVTEELQRLVGEGWKQLGDREYLNSGTATWTVITLQQAGVEMKRAYMSKEEKAVMMEARFDAGKDKQYQRTFEALLSNFVLTN